MEPAEADDDAGAVPQFGMPTVEPGVPDGVSVISPGVILEARVRAQHEARGPEQEQDQGAGQQGSHSQPEALRVMRPYEPSEGHQIGREEGGEEREDQRDEQPGEPNEQRDDADGQATVCLAFGGRPVRLPMALGSWATEPHEYARRSA
jgi:hypothetical protein